MLAVDTIAWKGTDGETDRRIWLSRVGGKTGDVGKPDAGRRFAGYYFA